MLSSICFMMFYVQTCKIVKFCLFWVSPHTSKMLSGRWIQCNYWRARRFQENYIGLTYFSHSEFASQLNLPLVVVSIVLDNNVRL